METNRMKVVNVPLDEITPYENNPRVNEGAVEQLAKIIEQFGFRNPAVLNKDKVIIEGHTRLLAVKKLGWETMPCIIATDLTPEQEQALRIADNKIAEIAEWDEDKLKVELAALQEAGFDLSLLAFQDDELDELLGGEIGTHGETEPDAAPEVPEVAVSKSGEVYVLGKHLLVCGDSTKAEDVAKVCGENEADLWLMDLNSGATRSFTEVNSPDTESYHSWSSNGRWIIFSSRRTDGNFTRPFIAHVDADGHGSKPFELPQADPGYHHELMKSYNIPEFMSGRVTFTPQQFADVLKGQEAATATFTESK